jgi:hypothetical protein
MADHTTGIIGGYMKTICTHLFETSNNCFFTVVIGNVRDAGYKVLLEGEIVPVTQRHMPWIKRPQAVTIKRFATEEYAGEDLAALLARAEARAVELGGDIRRRKSASAGVVRP